MGPIGVRFLVHRYRAISARKYGKVRIMRVLPSFKCRWHDVSVTVYPADGGFYDVEVIVGESVSERPMVTAHEAALEIGCSLGGDVGGIERQILAWRAEVDAERALFLGQKYDEADWADQPVFVCVDCGEPVQWDIDGLWRSALDGVVCWTGSKHQVVPG